MFSFVLCGFSGHLARTKIWPGFVDFVFEENSQEICQFFGVSRSKIEEKNYENLEKVQSKLGKNMQVLQVESYEKTEFWQNLLFTQKKNRVFIYLALPPESFLTVIEKVLATAEKLEFENFSLILEKPFASNFEEILQLKSLILQKNLEKKILFLDHYLFKSGLKIPKQVKFKLQELVSENSLEKIQIQILEKIGLEGRIGYFDQVGNLADMWPHFFSLLNLVFDIFVPKLSWNQKSQLQKIWFGQYVGYTQELGKNSQTETAFKLSLNTENLEKENPGKIIIDLEAVKKHAEKKTEIQFQLANQSSIIWQIFPETKIWIENQNHRNPLETIWFLEKQKQDHRNFFETLAENNFQDFLSIETVENCWFWLRDLQKQLTKIEIY